MDVTSERGRRRVIANLSAAYDLGSEVARLAFLWGYVPLIIYFGSQSTEDGLLNALFPPV
jgi:TOM7 family